MDDLPHLAARCKRQLSRASICFLTPQATEGPYYWNATIRQNITEGKAGIPLRLSISVIDTNTCAPLVNALVDLWHCDAVGIYSHYIAASQGIAGTGNDNETFFRGLALTNANGIAIFDTIYPGWYSGRATHIHMKVHVGSNVTSNSSGTYSGGHVSHTGQLFFNDTLTDSVATMSPYSTHVITRTRNSEDGIYASANGSVTIVSIIQNSANNYSGAVTVGVNSSATPAAVGGGEMGPGIGQMPPIRNNFSIIMANMTSVILTTTLASHVGAASALYMSCSTIFFAFLLYI
ncbi:unnamed protein product [Adineta steineri]|uniref:Intradiol ring-cleavage dioxygenases domain-containing protein n=1 Tax=Adineta steineri TaxID=433720 RepID=A0A815Z104_9BILA|nr:unnamed protein product [Adineta steineri]CAF1305186.1 unnamed protein product [Adineta steineri]CAF1344773.1 unnamed protein product [Adineta steineri]CAF1577526.1 unnamed protein product [Adineta steineri]